MNNDIVTLLVNQLLDSQQVSDLNFFMTAASICQLHKYEWKYIFYNAFYKANRYGKSSVYYQLIDDRDEVITDASKIFKIAADELK